MQPLINLEKYTAWQLGFNGFGCFLWLILYALLVRNIYRHKFVEMPVFAAAANISWEFLWAFVFTPDSGLLFAWAYRGAFLLDVYIFYNVYQHGHKQIQTPALKKHFKPVILLLLPAWVILLYFYTAEGYDTPIGANSGYILNLIIPALYILLALQMPSMAGFSRAIAWLNLLATGFITVSMFLIYPHSGFVQTMGVLVFILGAVYIWLFNLRRKGRLGPASMRS